MKVELAFLPNVRLSKILFCFVLNLPLFRFFSFILFILVFYFICILFLFLLKRFIVLKDSVLPVLTLKAKFLSGSSYAKKCLQAPKILGT